MPAPVVDAARIAAFDALRAVDERDACTPIRCCRICCGDAGLSGRDAALATELAYGTLRGRGTYDAVLSTNLDRALSS